MIGIRRCCVFCRKPRSTVDATGWDRCESCATNVISRGRDAREAAARVLTQIRHFSISISMPVRCEVVDGERLLELGGDDSTMGLTARQENLRWGRLEKKAEILVRRRLPVEVFESTLAHELVHVAVFESGRTDLPMEVEEGLAQYVSWRYLTEFATDSPVTLHWAKTIANHPDPIYGGGFRMVADRVAQEGFGPIWRAIRDGENPDRKSVV